MRRRNKVWTDNESQLFFKNYRDSRGNWKEVATMMNGRTQLQVWKFFNSSLQIAFEKIKKFFEKDEEKELEQITLTQIINSSASLNEKGSKGRAQPLQRVLQNKAYKIIVVLGQIFCGSTEQDLFKSTVSKIVQFEECYKRIRKEKKNLYRSNWAKVKRNQTRKKQFQMLRKKQIQKKLFITKQLSVKIKPLPSWIKLSPIFEDQSYNAKLRSFKGKFFNTNPFLTMSNFPDSTFSEISNGIEPQSFIDLFELSKSLNKSLQKAEK